MKVKFRNISQIEEDKWILSEHLVLAYGVWDENTSNGVKWFLVRHFQFDSTKALQVGFLAQSPTGKKCRVKFQNISYSARKIKDPYLGE